MSINCIYCLQDNFCGPGIYNAYYILPNIPRGAILPLWLRKARFTEVDFSASEVFSHWPTLTLLTTLPN